METGKKQWYIIQTYSGKENVVQKDLIQRITSCNMQDFIFQVIVPEETVQEKQKDNTIKEKIVKRFPGYIFVEMIDTDDSWWVVRNTPQVTGFLGSSGKKARPVPVPDEEMVPILSACGLVKAPEINYQVGDGVTIVNGSFKDRTGTIVSIDLDDKSAVVCIEMENGRTINVPIGMYDAEKNA